MSRKAIGFSFYVGLPTEISGKPEVRSIVNNFDYHGDLIGLKRITGEDNVSYRSRLLDVAVHPGGPLYEGVVNGIARDLGFIRIPSIKISLKLNSDGSPIALSPRVDILANRVVLYSDWRPDGTAIVDMEIRTYQRNDTGYYIDDLVSAINTSDYFYAELIGTIRPNTISSTMVRNTSNIPVRGEHIRADNLTQLEHTYIVRNSVTFLEKNIFETEVIYDPISDGEYKINYTTGEIQCKMIPSGNSFCSYHAANFPMTIDTVPIQIFTLQDDDFQDELFSKRELSSGELENSLLNPEGAEIYHQLYKECDIFWGK
jgi:hypothetical protein